MRRRGGGRGRNEGRHIHRSARRRCPVDALSHVSVSGWVTFLLASGGKERGCLLFNLASEARASDDAVKGSEGSEGCVAAAAWRYLFASCYSYRGAFRVVAQEHLGVGSDGRPLRRWVGTTETTRSRGQQDRRNTTQHKKILVLYILCVYTIILICNWWSNLMSSVRSEASFFSQFSQNQTDIYKNSPTNLLLAF